ncbi:MAG: PKD domain-containing protein [Candidatus Poseidoniia archaeon]|nr:PKD domain-containing protein [Candidatus Poseidoniia archaeon]MDP7081878.1 PKD domain-containing protein [Candidatus Poseidoniia archaeon]MDP7256085.1 PKD domain-containing protein [Candidatus Poseidoniia archaeon]MDP7473625.1 PKD domain-containing protein [Candidatus Poseidoniia archaeon]MDP7538060.1 PKD domain-containing protein [Candidatus Poseidoniia archaeon]
MRPFLQLTVLLLVAGCLDAGPGMLDGVSITSPEGVIEGDLAQFSASGLHPAGAHYYWEFGDGSGVVGQAVTHVYIDEGIYSVQLTVVAPDGAAGSASTTVEILHRNEAPTANAGPGQEARVHEQLRFDGSNSSDLEGSLNWTWDFGDGMIGVGPRPFHNYSMPGNYSVTLTVTDSEGLNATATTWAEVQLRQYAVSFIELQRSYYYSDTTLEEATTTWRDQNSTHNLTAASFFLVWQDETYNYRIPITRTDTGIPVPFQDDNFTLTATAPQGEGGSRTGETGQLLLEFSDVNSVPPLPEVVEAESEAAALAWLLSQGYTRSTGWGPWEMEVTCNDAPPDDGITELYLTDDDPGNDWTLTVTYTFYEARAVEILI